MYVTFWEGDEKQYQETPIDSQISFKGDKPYAYVNELKPIYDKARKKVYDRVTSQPR
jgi:hypothetical protein